MALDHAYGMSVLELATREYLSVARVYQLLDGLAMQVLGMPGCAAIRYRREDFIHRLRGLMQPLQWPAPDTPEAFYYEVMAEPKTRSYI
jgi:hypothetical protein